MRKKEIPKPGHRYVLDIEKLFQVFENKRKQDKLSRDRIAARYGLAKNSLTVRSRRSSLDAKVLIPILMYLDKPITDFIKTVEVSNGSQNGRNTEDSRQS